MDTKMRRTLMGEENIKCISDDSIVVLMKDDEIDINMEKTFNDLMKNKLDVIKNRLCQSKKEQILLLGQFGSNQELTNDCITVIIVFFFLRMSKHSSLPTYPSYLRIISKFYTCLPFLMAVCIFDFSEPLIDKIEDV
ncbi:hypothetical protein A3Q56_04974 [Intoshia linei]|uniref:Uncharacterized protein n=1 Tax=Intoshia linei TaxID=1819745 RepID=A0A177AZK5_9BILA|nr:hypothetical protein A3Q56_04974 [Intoshia linei]